MAEKGGANRAGKLPGSGRGWSVREVGAALTRAAEPMLPRPFPAADPGMADGREATFRRGTGSPLSTLPGSGVPVRKSGGRRGAATASPRTGPPHAGSLPIPSARDRKAVPRRWAAHRETVGSHGCTEVDQPTPSFSAAMRVPSTRFLIFWNATSRA
jgi:hypothetical protein